MKDFYLFKFSVKSFPGLNLIPFFAGICIFSPVCRFLHVLGALVTTSNFPKPIKDISLPSSKTSVNVSMKAVTFFLPLL